MIRVAIITGVNLQSVFVERKWCVKVWSCLCIIDVFVLIITHNILNIISCHNSKTKVVKDAHVENGSFNNLVK